MRRLFLCSLLAFTCLFLSACGGGSEDPPPDVENKKGGLIPRGVNQAGRQPVREAPKPVPTASKEKPKETPVPKEEPSPIDPSTNPNDIFVVAGNAREFDAAGTFPEVDPADMFAVVRLPAGEIDRMIATPPLNGDASGSGTQMLPAGFRSLPGGGFSDSGWPLRIVCEKDRSVMAFIPGGTSPIGTNDGPKESSPELSVYLESYYIDVTEVTLTQYGLFRDAIKEERNRKIREPMNASDPPDFPVLGMTYSESLYYSNWCGKAIPNEAEWEKAARGESGARFPWGSGRTIWARHRTPDQIDPVKSFRTDQSIYGVFDLAGNALEWCEDNYSPIHYAETAKNETVVRRWRGARQDPNSKELQVVRGGAEDWSAWHRAGRDPRDRDPRVGFRCVLRVGAK